jgi:hypothetical protein
VCLHKDVLRTSLALAILIQLIWHAPAAAQGFDAFGGEWKNSRETRGIVGARIYADRERWMVQLLGACHPNPCVWEPEPLELIPSTDGGPPMARATFRRANMRRVMMFRLGEDALVVEIASTAAPTARGRGFSTRTSDELRRTSLTTGPLTPMRRK